MFENFEINHYFEGTVREQPHFSLNIQGHDYKGMVHDGKIHWYNPHPKQKVAQDYLSAVESKVFIMMSDYLEQ